MNLKQAQQLIKINQDSYNKIADTFSDSRNSAWQEIELAVKKYVKDGNKILDLGCGNGRLLQSLKNIKNINYIGLDNSNTLIKKAQDKNKDVKLICDDVLNIAQFEQNEFDMIFMMASFHHIPSNELRNKLMQDLYHVLKPGGYLIMTNWNLWNLKSKKNIWRVLLSSSRMRGSKSRKKNKGSWIPAYVGMTKKDLITLWQNKYPLYYYAFCKYELKKIFKKSKFKVLENYYVKKGNRSHWWNGWNILTIGQK